MVSDESSNDFDLSTLLDTVDAGSLSLGALPGVQMC